MEIAEQNISKSRSFKGYSFKVWLKRNKNTLKTLISWGFSVAVFFIPQFELTESLALATGAKIVSQLALDAFDFWLSDVTLA